MVLAARPVVGTLDEARDCASLAIVQYLEQAPRDVENLEAFLVTIAKRRAIDHVRAQSRARLRDERFAHETALSAPDVAEDVATRAEAYWADQEARRLLQPRVYELLQLVADGVPLSEVAQRLDMTERAAQSHLLRARRVVRAALAKTLAALGLGAAAVRRWWGPAAMTAPVLAAVFILAIGTAEAPALTAKPPALTLLPRTTDVQDAEATAGLSGAGTGTARRTGDSSATRGTPAKPPRRNVVKVLTPVGGVGLDERDNGHQSDNEVEAVLWCLQHLRIELNYQGCDDGSSQQGAGQPAGDGPLLPSRR
jgi:RNA polymerase sigma factor (sigma-70 family)